jgi:hypothetical protein
MTRQKNPRQDDYPDGGCDAVTGSECSGSPRKAQPESATSQRKKYLRPGAWSAMSNMLVDSGAISQIDASALRVYIAMTRKANWRQGGRVIASQKDLGRLVGLCERSARTAVQELISKGLIRRLHRGGGRVGDAAEYQVLLDSENRQSASGSENENRHNLSQEPATESREPAESDVRTGNALAYQTDVPDINPTNSSRPDAATAGDGLCGEETEEIHECRIELVNLGIAEPKLSELLRHPDMSWWVIEKAQSTLDYGRPVGALVKGIEAVLPVATELQHREAVENEETEARARRADRACYPDRREMLAEMKGVPTDAGSRLRQQASTQFGCSCPDDWHLEDRWVRAIYDLFRVWQAETGWEQATGQTDVCQ